MTSAFDKDKDEDNNENGKEEVPLSFQQIKKVKSTMCIQPEHIIHISPPPQQGKKNIIQYCMRKSLDLNQHPTKLYTSDMETMHKINKIKTRITKVALSKNRVLIKFSWSTKVALIPKIES